MAKIVSYPIENGNRFAVEDTCHVDVTNDQRFFTIYDKYWEPIGTITRPLVTGGNRFWESHLPNGETCTKTAVGPRSAFRSFLIAYRA
jgi:hypothetical protein